MRPESLMPDFPPVNQHVPVSIRAERVELVVSGIRDSNMEPVVQYLDDYGASRAEELAQRHPSALGYVCLSDEIAVGLLQLLRARGNSDAQRRILGFDGSELARKHRISSFDQRLSVLGDKLMEQFLSEFRHPRDAVGSSSECREIGIELDLRMWGGE
jgi:DNA-binding LacI/PurR family transcriptional regulator